MEELIIPISLPLVLVNIYNIQFVLIQETSYQ